MPNHGFVDPLSPLGKPNTTKDGHDVRSVKVADKTGCINLSIWDEAGAQMMTGDICKLNKGYAYN